MKVNDFIFRCPSRSSIGRDGICRVRLFVVDSQLYVVITDLGEKRTGTSVTNSIEYIWQGLIEKGLILEKTKVIEHYDREGSMLDTFNFVFFDDNNNPSWDLSNVDNICSILDCDENEFKDCSLEIPRLYEEIERIRHDIDCHIDEPWPEPFEVINRRDDIRSNALPEGKLLEAVTNGASETEIQKLIKSDLSIMGDFYAQFVDEYICFTEFPLADGFVDFVVFSGTSRMEVTLIEIKGADYNLINSNSYGDFSAKTNQAVQQIRNRLGYIARNYQDFRKYVHKVRQAVEGGKSKYGSFMGPVGELQVDPNKDVVLHTVVIGGRSKNDIHESRLRHDYESDFSPSIKIETWDSWLNKSKRK